MLKALILALSATTSPPSNSQPSLPGWPVPIIDTCPGGGFWSPVGSPALWKAVADLHACLAEAEDRFHDRLDQLPTPSSLWSLDSWAAILQYWADRAACYERFWKVYHREKRRACGQ
ncbi:MAG: hypothetical protein QGH76_08850 [Phycisphaerales bacterium]|jgi:hypothetical protein|nr:hypothetical protein [Phycisphaerales bacterium]